MITAVLVHNRQLIEHYADEGTMSPVFDRWYLISIHDHQPLTFSQCARLKSKGSQAICSVSFGGSSDFTGDKARKIVDFLAKAQQDTEPSALLIHCMAGVSRSGAVGKFACEYCGIPYASLKKASPDIDPDPGIVDMLERV